jgi:hypothetical protein
MADARRRARDEPLLLSRNWCTAVLVFFAWAVLALWLVHVLVQRYGDAELVEFEWAALAGARFTGAVLVRGEGAHLGKEGGSCSQARGACATWGRRAETGTGATAYHSRRCLAR